MRHELSQSHRSELNRRPLDYESSALPLSYCGNVRELHALTRTRTATPFGTASSRLRVYQFHHQGLNCRMIGGWDDRMIEQRAVSYPPILLSAYPPIPKRGRRGSNPQPLE